MDIEAQPRHMPALLPWLQDHGGYCDCEVIMNVLYLARNSAPYGA
jgi:Protein of unknown function (DUF2695)